MWNFPVFFLEKWFNYQRNLLVCPHLYLVGHCIFLESSNWLVQSSWKNCVLGLLEKTCACGWMCTYHNNERNGTSVGVCLAEFQLNAFSVDSIYLYCQSSSTVSEDFKRCSLLCLNWHKEIKTNDGKLKCQWYERRLKQSNWKAVASVMILLQKKTYLFYSLSPFKSCCTYPSSDSDLLS